MIRTRFPALLATLALLLTACAQATPTGPRNEDGPIGHPTSGSEAVLKISHEGGLIPVEHVFTGFPTFALYGDGTLIEPGAQIAIYPGQALPSIWSRPLTEEGVQAVLRAALAAGLDTDASYTDFGSTFVADASTTVFELTANGATHRVEVYALGVVESELDKPQGMAQDEWQARLALQSFLEELGSMAEWLPEGSIGDSTEYVATGARVLVGPYVPDEELPQGPVAWPLEAPLSSFGSPWAVLDGARCGVVEGQEWEILRDAAAGANQRTPWVQEDTSYGLSFRPLLPDERGC